jgi:phosphoglycolate phosphatase
MRNSPLLEIFGFWYGRARKMDFGKYQHIIWDWNGTLLDDVELCVQIGNRLLTRRSMPNVTVGWYQENFDFPVIDYYRKIGFDFSVESFEEVAHEYISQYNARRFECCLHEKALEVLNFFKELAVTQSVLSAYQQTSLQEAVGFFGLSHYFTELIGLNDFYAGSKMENGKRFIKSLGKNKENVLFIGDTSHDFEVAQAIGADCLLVCNGHNNRQKLQACDAYLVDNLAEILA